MNNIDLNKFKPKNGERYIFMENGVPSFVLLDFNDYSSMQNKKKEEQSFPKEPIDASGEDLTVEDLPF